VTPEHLRSGRKRYEDREFLERGLPTNPVELLRSWLEDAYLQRDLLEPNAMCVATADAGGQPSARVVLLRGLDDRGLIFYTSYFSRKARQLDTNPRAAATFFWAPLHRQVRVEGRVSRLPDDESDAYFASRPRGHQLAAWASEQSEPIDDRATLEERMQHFDGRFEGEEVPRPHSWGGYLIAPDRFEFWQGRANRLHDRIEYGLDGSKWATHRLQP
jgi:pyridoxamine 5'-phosphate oxidase